MGLGGGEGGAWTGPGGDNIGFAWTIAIAVCGEMTGADLAGTVSLCCEYCTAVGIVLQVFWQSVAGVAASVTGGLLLCLRSYCCKV